MSTIAMGSAGAAVADFVRGQILSGELRPGDRIRQEEVAAANGTSRVPVREALRVLENEGLVILVPNSGARVAELDFNEFQELYRIRELLEPLLLTDSVPALTEEAILLAAQLVEEMEITQDVGTWIELDRQFHVGLYVEETLPRAYRLVRDFWNLTQPYRRSHVDSLSTDERLMVNAEHRMILTAIRLGDGEGAGDSLRGHIRRTRTSLARDRSKFDT